MVVPPPAPARPLRPFPLIHHSWQVTKPTHPIMALMAVSKSPPQFMNTRVTCVPMDESKRRKRKGIGKTAHLIAFNLASLPHNNSSFYSGLPLLSTSKMVTKQENSVLDRPKEYAFTAGYFNFLVVVFSPGQVLLANGEEKFVKSYCHGGKICLKNLLPWQCDVTLLFLITVLLLLMTFEIKSYMNCGYEMKMKK